MNLLLFFELLLLNRFKIASFFDRHGRPLSFQKRPCLLCGAMSCIIPRFKRRRNSFFIFEVNCGWVIRSDFHPTKARFRPSAAVLAFVANRPRQACTHCVSRYIFRRPDTQIIQCLMAFFAIAPGWRHVTPARRDPWRLNCPHLERNSETRPGNALPKPSKYRPKCQATPPKIPVIICPKMPG